MCFSSSYVFWLPFKLHVLWLSFKLYVLWFKLYVLWFKAAIAYVVCIALAAGGIARSDFRSHICQFNANLYCFQIYPYYYCGIFHLRPQNVHVESARMCYFTVALFPIHSDFFPSRLRMKHCKHSTSPHNQRFSLSIIIASNISCSTIITSTELVSRAKEGA
jgi:hypothetical protein